MVHRRLVLPVLLLLAGCNLWAEPRWQASPEVSRMIVYRPGNLTGFAKRFMLQANGREQAQIGNGQYWVMDVAPGRHVLSLASGQASQTVTAAVGQAYYLRIEPYQQQEEIRARLQSVPYAVAAKELEGLSQAERYQAPERGEDMNTEQNTGPRI